MGEPGSNEQGLPTQAAPQLQHAPELAADVTTDAVGTLYWMYAGDVERVYPHIPVTIKRNEIIKWPELPAEDGNWQAVEFVEGNGFVLREPDNTPVASTVDAPAAEHNEQ